MSGSNATPCGEEGTNSSWHESRQAAQVAAAHYQTLLDVTQGVPTLFVALILGKPRGGSRPERGGGSWGSGPPPPFSGDPYKKEQNVMRVHVETSHFSTQQFPGPLPFRNPVSAPEA